MLPRDINGWVSVYGDDFGYIPKSLALPTKSPPGSQRRIDILQRRIAEGRPLFVAGDNSLVPMRSSGLDDVCGTVSHGDRYCGAQYSRCEKYQYRLWRRWSEDPDKPIASVITLHPELHQHNELTPKLRKIMSYCMRFGCAGFDLLSLFAFRSNTWGGVMRAEWPVGDECDRAIRVSTERTSFTICCWGKCGMHFYRSARVLWGLRKRVEAKKLLCFGLTEKELSPIKPIDDSRVILKREVPGLHRSVREVLHGKRKQGYFLARDGDSKIEVSYDCVEDIQRMVCQPIEIEEAGRQCVTIQLPFRDVDYNDVDDSDIQDEELTEDE